MEFGADLRVWRSTREKEGPLPHFLVSRQTQKKVGRFLFAKQFQGQAGLQRNGVSLEGRRERTKISERRESEEEGGGGGGGH